MLMWRLLDEDEKFHAANVRDSLRVPGWTLNDVPPLFAVDAFANKV